jgi:hypothetical protein
VSVETEQFSRDSEALATWAAEQHVKETQQMEAVGTHLNTQLAAPYTSALEAVVVAVLSQHGALFLVVWGYN